jgi:hypothetical protein
VQALLEEDVGGDCGLHHFLRYSRGGLESAAKGCKVWDGAGVPPGVFLRPAEMDWLIEARRHRGEPKREQSGVQPTAEGIVGADFRLSKDRRGFGFGCEAWSDGKVAASPEVSARSGERGEGMDDEFS